MNAFVKSNSMAASTEIAKTTKCFQDNLISLGKHFFGIHNFKKSVTIDVAVQNSYIPDKTEQNNNIEIEALNESSNRLKR